MIKNLTLRNFRAFRSEIFEFSKFNIFVGPNNSGKSSAISAINLIAQTFNNAEISQSPLVLNGLFDRLGTYLDLVHGNRSNTPLGIDISIDDYAIKFDYKYRQQRREIELVKFQIDEKNKNAFSYESKKDSFSMKLMGKDVESLQPFVRKRRPQFYRLIPTLRFSSTISHSPDMQEAPTNVRNILFSADRALMRARSQLTKTFGDFDSLGPFRDRPERTYLYSGEVAQRIGTTGSNMALMLASDTSKRGAESQNIIDEISRWFKISGIAEQVRVKSLTPRHFELVLADVNGNEQNICDVGFGCSQVMPVLAASLNMFSGNDSISSFKSPTLIVQGPEIHLHPNAQASLGSFFSRLMQSEGQIFVETHSDNLVLRVARHVADGTLKENDVKIFYVHKINGSPVVQNISITGNGRFQPEWPGGFFPQRQSESLNLAQAAFRKTTPEKKEAKQSKFKYPEEIRSNNDTVRD